MSEDPRRDWGDAYSLPFTLVGLVGIFAGLGYLLDRWIGTKPWFMVAGVFLGAIFGFVYLVSLLFLRPRNGRGRKKPGTSGGSSGGPDGDSQ
jgi:F0F1-type ATP synthase assembly protein I